MGKMQAATTNRIFHISRKHGRLFRLQNLSHVKACIPVLLLLIASSRIFGLSFQQPSATDSQTATPQIVHTDGDLISMPIDSGDLIDVQVFSTPELSGRLRVDEGGYINLPAGGRLHISTLTARQASVAIENLLRKNEIMMNPEVTVFIVEYATQGITVLGEVKSPGTYSLLGPHSLYDVLAAAGGPTQSQGANITIVHKHDPDNPQIIPVHSPNYSAEQQATQIHSGDTVVVSRASIIYIMGDVSRSGAFYIQTGGPLTVLNGIAMAQGLNRTASTKHAEIIRKTDTDTRLISLNLNDILKHKQTDIVLEAGDILYIPSSEWKRFVQTFGPASAQAVANAAAIAAIAN
jgi:polysaccharide export outer membrane protein